MPIFVGVVWACLTSAAVPGSLVSAEREYQGTPAFCARAVQGIHRVLQGEPDGWPRHKLRSRTPSQL